MAGNYEFWQVDDAVSQMSIAAHPRLSAAKIDFSAAFQTSQ